MPSPNVYYVKLGSSSVFPSFEEKNKSFKSDYLIRTKEASKLYFLIESLRQKTFRNDTFQSAGVAGFCIECKGHITLGHSLTVKHNNPCLIKHHLATLI